MALTRQTPAPLRRIATAAALVISIISSATLVSPARARSVEVLPYLQDVHVTGPQSCDACPPRVCATGPLTLKIVGAVPGCVEYTGLQVVFRRGAPTPLIFADFVADTCDADCRTFIRTFADSVVIQDVPEMPMGTLDLWFESHVRICPDTSVIAIHRELPLPIEVLECAEVGPPRIALGPGRPNPLTSSTSFTVSLPEAAHVEITVHDLLGRRVATLLSQDLPAGRRDATWSAANARDGVYFARLVVNGRVFTQHVALVRDRP